MRLSNADRLAFVWLYRLCPAAIDAVTIIRPETLIRWHRRGFRAFWRWKSRPRGGRAAARRECIDHVIVLAERHLRRIMSRYAGYYNPAS